MAVDLASIQKLGLIDEEAIDEEGLEDDEALLAEFAELQGTAPKVVKKDPAMLRAEATKVKREALALKRAGQQQEAIAKLREAKALESEAEEGTVSKKEAEDSPGTKASEMPAMEALAQVALPDAVKDDKKIAAPIDDDDPALAAEMAALSSGEGERVVAAKERRAPPTTTTAPLTASKKTEDPRVAALKQKALALKRAGDVEGAIASLKQAKALEAAPAALERVQEVQKTQARRDVQKEWRAYAAALDTAMRAAVTDAKRRLTDGDADGARATAARAKDLKSMRDAAALQKDTTTSAPPSFRLVDVTDRAPRFLRDVPEDRALVRLSRLRFPIADKTARSIPFNKVKFQWDFAGQAQGETDVFDLTPHGAWLVCDTTVELSVTLDAALVAARKLLKAKQLESTNNGKETLPEKRKLEVAKRALSKFSRTKLSVDAVVLQGGLGGLFGRRETLAARAKVGLDPLLDRASLKDSAKLRADPEAPPVLAKGGQFDAEVRLREPLRDPEIVTVVCRQDIVVLEDHQERQNDVSSSSSSSSTKQPVTNDKRAATATPPAAECKDPHAPTLLLSDRVLEHEIALADAAVKDNDLAATARRLALATAHQLLVAEVESQKLTPAVYAQRIAQRRQADVVLATWLQANDRPHDALRVRKRAALMGDELAELRDAGQIPA